MHPSALPVANTYCGRRAQRDVYVPASDGKYAIVANGKQRANGARYPAVGALSAVSLVTAYALALRESVGRIS